MIESNAKRYNVRIVGLWQPRELNTRADELSRLVQESGGSYSYDQRAPEKMDLRMLHHSLMVTPNQI